MTLPETKTFVPLYFTPDPDGPDCGGHKISLIQTEGATLVTKDNYSRLCKQGLDQVGYLTVWVMDSASAAKGAEMAIEADPNAVWAAMSAQADNGAGILLKENLHGVTFGIDVIDKREPDRAEDAQILGSWDYGEVEFGQIRSEWAARSNHSLRFASHIARQVENFANVEATQWVQTSLQYLPGAMVSFVDVDLGVIADSHGIAEWKDVNAAQQELHHAALKFQSPSSSSVVMDHVNGRMSALIDEHVDGTAPAP